MSPRFDHDVLVVGLGPVGAVMAALLAQQGLSVLAVDRETEPYPLPRAVHFDHEIMRLFQQLGVADAVQAHARDLPLYEFRNAAGDVLMRMAPVAEAPSGWASGYMFHQPGLEAVLRGLVQTSAGADMRLGWRLDAFAQDVDAVTATLKTPDGPRTVRSRYLIGCDGASSRVRDGIGGGLFDYQFDEPWLVVDVKARPGARLPDRNLQLCDPARPTTCVFGGPGRHRWEFMLLPGETAEQMLAEGVAEQLIGPWDCGPLEIERRAVYRFHGLVANRWRDRRVFLAGDAAHQTPPFAGQGMCSGLRDAANLAWKLAAVLRGTAGDALLDTYQQEREPHVRGAIELAIGMGRVVCTLDPEAAAARDAGMLAQLASGARPSGPPGAAPFADGFILAGAPSAGALFPQPTVGEGDAKIRLDDVLPAGAWLISRGAAPPEAPGLCSFALDDAPALAPFRARLEAWLDRQGAPAVLVRPDRYIFGAGEGARLREAWVSALARTDQPAAGEVT